MKEHFIVIAIFTTVGLIGVAAIAAPKVMLVLGFLALAGCIIGLVYFLALMEVRDWFRRRRVRRAYDWKAKRKRSNKGLL